MPEISDCPKCGAQFVTPRPEESACPVCGVWFHKLKPASPLPPPVPEPPTPIPRPIPTPTQVSTQPAPGLPASVPMAQSLLLVFLAVWGFRLASNSYENADMFDSFMHNILLPIHEAGHIFLRPFGDFMTVLGGSLFQVALPFGIGVAFLVKQRDAFGAAVCLWWTGTSFLDLAPYVWDSLDPQLILLGGHTGQDGGHDWIYLLSHFGILDRAHAWGAGFHFVGVMLMLIGICWGVDAVVRMSRERVVI